MDVTIPAVAETFLAFVAQPQVGEQSVCMDTRYTRSGSGMGESRDD